MLQVVEDHTGATEYYLYKGREKVQGEHRDSAGRVQGEVRKSSGRVQGEFRESSERVQGEFRESACKPYSQQKALTLLPLGIERLWYFLGLLVFVVEELDLDVRVARVTPVLGYEILALGRWRARSQFSSEKRGEATHPSDSLSQG